MANGVFTKGDGTTLNPYIIEDEYDLDKVRENPSANYSIIKNIDVLNICNKNGAEGWEPIADFSGILEGNGHIIKNLTINRTSDDSVGLFSSIRGGAIINLGIRNATISGKDYVGGLVGSMSANDDLIENCFVTGSIIGNNYSGGIVGSFTSGTIINSFAEGTVTSTYYCGGIAGYMYGTNAYIKNSYAACTCNSNDTSGIKGLASYTGSRLTGNIVNSFYDNTLCFNDTTSVGKLSTQDMKKEVTFTSWKNQYYSFDKPVWVFKNDSYPQLYYLENTKYVVLVNNEYKTFKDNMWNTVSKTFPDEASFETHGMTDLELSEIPRYKWNELRQYKTFELIASTDKFAIERKTIRKKMEVDSQYASCVVLKAELNLDQIGDSINRIRIVH